MILINSSPKDALKIFQPFLPIFVPVGVGCLLSAAEKEKIPVKYIDQQVEDDIFRKIDDYTKEFQPPYIFGFSVLTAALKEALSVSRELKRKYPDSFIIFGGVHPTAMPEEVLSYEYVDVVVTGEGEKALVELYKCIKNGRDFRHLDNISFRKGAEFVNNKRSFILDNLDAYPRFPYHLFSPNLYDLGFVLSSRGCPYECIFCSNRVTTGKKYRYRSAGVIVEDLEMLYKKYNKRSVLFLDDNFLVNKERIYLLIGEIKKKGLDKKMIFNFQARGDNVNNEILTELYNSGFKSIFFGIETSNEKIMKIIKKNETVAQCVAAAKLAKKIGFHVSATFIYGLPGETRQDRVDCVNLSREIGLDMVRYNNATPYPGTELYEIAKAQNRLNIYGVYENFNSVSTFIENPLKKIPFSYVLEGSLEEEIRRDVLFSYFRYYLDFQKIKQIFSKPELGVGWFNAGENFLKLIKKIPALIFLGIMIFFKFCQMFYYMVLKRKTRISMGEFLKVFDGLLCKKAKNNT